MTRSSYKLILAGLLTLFLASGLYTSPPPEQVDAKELRCLALNIHYEARGEPFAGKLAVAHVAINRLYDKAFPGVSLCEIIFQPRQFSWTHQFPRWRSTQVPPETEELAMKIMLGKYEDPTAGALFYHNLSVRPFKRHRVAKIGHHIFYT